MQAFTAEASSFSDPTDWLTTSLPSLMQLEQTLRCHVCKEFFKDPMLTSCNHTFCSLCIRRCLAADSKCPLCRLGDQETKLRGNWGLREAVAAFMDARDSVLEVARRGGVRSPKRKLEVGEEEDLGGSNKRPRRPMKARKAKEKQVVEDSCHEEQGDDAYYPAPESREIEQTAADGLVACPICNARMKDYQVGIHLDHGSCPGPEASPPPKAKRPQPASRTLRTARTRAIAHLPERLPSVAYGVMRDAQLRSRLRDEGLRTTGTRPEMERRHTEWLTIWNANCDSQTPKSRAELLREMEAWERMNPVKGAIPVARTGGEGIKGKDFDRDAWGARHEGSFKELVDKARGIRRTGKEWEKAEGEVSKERQKGAIGVNGEDGAYGKKASLETPEGNAIGPEKVPVPEAISMAPVRSPTTTILLRNDCSPVPAPSRHEI